LPNRLAVFDLLLAKQSVSETARGLRLTQSATSHTLKGFRRHCGDEILVRIGDRNAANTPSIRMGTAIATKVYGRAEAIRPEPGGEFDKRLIVGSIWLSNATISPGAIVG
jgi:DNA-binding transcriptional LysR family regulator